MTNVSLCFRQGGGAGHDATDAGRISETGAAFLVLYLLLLLIIICFFIITIITIMSDTVWLSRWSGESDESSRGSSLDAAGQRVNIPVTPKPAPHRLKALVSLLTMYTLDSVHIFKYPCTSSISQRLFLNWLSFLSAVTITFALDKVKSYFIIILFI